MRQMMWFVGLLALVATSSTWADDEVAILVATQKQPNRQQFHGHFEGHKVGVNLVRQYIITKNFYQVPLSDSLSVTQECIERWTASCNGLAFRPGQVDTIGTQLQKSSLTRDQKFSWFREYLINTRTPSLPGSRDYVF